METIRKKLCILILIFSGFLLQSLVVRHDVPDEEFIELAREYPQLCHFSDGEGTLIAPSWVLTAAHVAEYHQDNGTHENRSKIIIGREQYEIERVVLHPNYSFTKYQIANDIALVKIKGAVKNIVPVDIYEGDDEWSKSIVIVGRGDFGTGLTGPKKSDQITRAATNIIDDVSEEWVSFVFDAPTSDHTTYLEGVSGPGDSGGPAFVEIGGRRFIVGVSSHQSDNGKKGIYGVTEHYSRVSHYADWIRNTVFDEGN